MNIKEQSKLIGQIKNYAVSNGSGKMSVKVEILDVKSAYGRERFLIKPIKGEGEIWVEQLS